MTAPADAMLDGLPDRFPPHLRSLPRLLAAQAARWPDRPLFSAGDASWTVAQCAAVAAAAAATLAGAGIGRGDRVAILCGNRPAFMQAFLGTACRGAVLVPVNTAAKGPQVRYALENSSARLLIAEDELLDAVAAAGLDTLPVERVWIVGAGPAAALPVPANPMPPADPGFGGSPTGHGDPGPGDTAAILYTSGTTGPSKGVCCPHAQLFWWGVHTARHLGLRADDVLCTVLPLFHTNALNTFFQALVTGASMAVEARFSASGFWRTMIERRATATYVLGAMVPILLARPPSPEERGHGVRVALAPGVPAPLYEAFTRRTGVAMVDGFGSTESNFVIGGPAAARQAGFMGTVTPGFQARVVDDADNRVAPGEAGELVLRADEPFAFATGYWGMPEKTVESWRNLWFHTGDRVVEDAQGRFRFVDRMKDAIRRRGENISSFEVEQVMASCPGIAAVAVFPVGSDLAEDEVMAAIVADPASPPVETAILDYCVDRLPHYAVPRYLAFVAELPRTENGKVQKFRLRERGVTPDTWDREAHGYEVRRRRR